MTFHIRPYQPVDLAAVSRICLLTGDNGRDASSIYQDPELLAHNFTSPYVVLEPELCRLLIHESEPCGYVMGTRDSVSFYERCEREWFPALRQRYPVPLESDHSPDANLIRLIHTQRMMTDNLQPYPAHLHLDLLPIAQGQGWGPKMMTELLDLLRTLGVPGVHLSVGSQNLRAIRFYEKMGFHVIKEDDASLMMGRMI